MPIRRKRQERPPVPPSDWPSSREAYVRVEAELLALPKARVRRVTADASVTAKVALGAARRVEVLRKEFVAQLVEPPLRELQMLPLYALALIYTDTQVLLTPRVNVVPSLVKEARALREKLLMTAAMLVRFGKLDRRRVAAIRSGRANLDLATDLIELASMFRDRWAHVDGKTPVTIEMLRRAETLGTELLTALGQRKVATLSVEPTWVEKRARAFRLVVDCYDTLVGAVTYVRWKQRDTKRFLPALHARAGAGRPRTKKE